MGSHRCELGPRDVPDLCRRSGPRTHPPAATDRGRPWFGTPGSPKGEGGVRRRRAHRGVRGDDRRGAVACQQRGRSGRSAPRRVRPGPAARRRRAAASGGDLCQPARVQPERGHGGHSQRGGGIARHSADRPAAGRWHWPGNRPRQRGRPPGGFGGHGSDVASGRAQPGGTRIVGRETRRSGSRWPEVSARRSPRARSGGWAADARRAGSAAWDERDLEPASRRAISPARRVCSARVSRACSRWTSGWRVACVTATCRCGRPRRMRSIAVTWCRWCGRRAEPLAATSVPAEAMEAQLQPVAAERRSRSNRWARG